MAGPKSEDMLAKPVFARAYERSSEDLRALFDALHDRAIAQCPRACIGYTNKPDFRLSLPPTLTRRWQTFCELVLEPAQLTVQCNLRIDGLRPDDLQRHAPALRLKRMERRPEETLITFSINDTQITDTVDLIAHVYAFLSHDLPPDVGPASTPPESDAERLKAHLRVGGKIHHATWGIGMIQTLIERGQLLRLTVDFLDHGPKTFPFNQTILTLLDDDGDAHGQNVS